MKTFSKVEQINILKQFFLKLKPHFFPKNVDLNKAYDEFSSAIRNPIVVTFTHGHRVFL